MTFNRYHRREKYIDLLVIKPDMAKRTSLDFPKSLVQELQEKPQPIILQVTL